MKNWDLIKRILGVCYNKCFGSQTTNLAFRRCNKPPEDSKYYIGVAQMEDLYSGNHAISEFYSQKESAPRIIEDQKDLFF